MNHTFFKALLFLSAGSVIHAMLDEQDMHKMGGLAYTKYMISGTFAFYLGSVFVFFIFLTFHYSFCLFL